MKHYLYPMSASVQAPAGGGDTRSWFNFYKWQVEGEVQVPWTWDYPHMPIEEGDVLWFAMDDLVIGAAIVLRVTEDSLNDRWEVWYDGAKVIPAENHATLAEIPDPVGSDRQLSKEVGDQWLNQILERNPLSN